MTFLGSQTLASRHLPKVPIPRLQRSSSDETQSTKKRRISRACRSCRERKVRCDGGRPQCQNCQDCARQCVYELGRKDHLKTAMKQNQRMIALLKDLRHSVPGEQKQQIDDLLEQVANDIADPPTSLQRSSTPDNTHFGGDTCREIGLNDTPDKALFADGVSWITRFGEGSFELQWPQDLECLRVYHEGASSRIEDLPWPS